MSTQLRFWADGRIPIKQFRAKLAGQFELTPDDLAIGTIDGVVVGVFVARVHDYKDAPTKDGDFGRTYTYALLDTRLVDDELKRALVERLDLAGADSLFMAPIPPPAQRPSDVDEDGVRHMVNELDEPAPDTGPPPDQAGQDPAEVFVPDQGERIEPEGPGAPATVDDITVSGPGAVFSPSQATSDGPKVARFEPDATVRDGDPALTKFLSEV